MTPIKVLILSRNYPNAVMPRAGLWVEGLVRALDPMCEVRVVSPVPYCPPLPGFVEQTRLRDIPPRDRINGMEVRHPRFATGPGYSLHSYEADTYSWGVRREVDRLRREFSFDVIHGHFSYPDGVAAVRLARRYGVPALITEHAPWLPWMEQYPRVRRQAVWASGKCAFHVGVSRYVRDTIAHFTPESENLCVVPVGVDGSVFVSDPDIRARDPNLILYVGRIHPIKGIDILLLAIRRLIDRRPEARLLLVGGSGLFRDYRKQERRLRAMARQLDLGRHVEFVGEKSPREVAQLMRESSVVVLPSRAESFGAVLVEALSCGIPVVATRCGGPEDIVNEGVGVLVEKEDVEALATAMQRVLSSPERYDPHLLRRYALDYFAWDLIGRRYVDLYRKAVNGTK